ncbi:hypothetical protein Trydic_g5071 [Trypoxylus dichotomus]
MNTKRLVYLSLFICVSHGRILSSDLDYVDSDGMSSMSVYYDVASRLPLRLTSIQNSLSDSLSDIGQSATKTIIFRRFGYRSNGCTCQELTCGCCAGFNLQQFNFSREGCMNFTYDPLEFSISMTMFFDNHPIFSNSFSAKNPPPLCIPVPIPYVPGVDFCAKLFDIYTPGQNLHMCLDFETRIQRATILVLHFDCMTMGRDGVSLLKPGQSPQHPATTETSVVDSDVYDIVTEIKYRRGSGNSKNGNGIKL